MCSRKFSHTMSRGATIEYKISINLNSSKSKLIKSMRAYHKNDSKFVYQIEIRALKLRPL